MIFDSLERSRGGTIHLRGTETSGMARSFWVLASPSAGVPVVGFWGLLAPSPLERVPPLGQVPGPTLGGPAMGRPALLGGAEGQRPAKKVHSL